MIRNWNVIIEIAVAHNCETKEEAIQKVKDQYGSDVEIISVR